MGKHFGTDGVRGVANTELTSELAFRLGQAGAIVLGREHKRPLFVVGRDTRISGDMLEAALTAGILSAGGDVISAGVIPTPAVAYLARHYGAAAGAVISASHNPFEYNGIKFFKGDGFKLDDGVEEEIEEILESGYPGEALSGEDIGVRTDASREAAELYTDFLVESAGINLTGKKIVLDCANGASYKVAPAVYASLGAELTVIGAEPDGVNINDNIGSTHPEMLCETVKKAGADIGLAFDGDADRLIAADEKGNVVDGDRTICICAAMMKNEGRLSGNRVTATVMSNIGFHKYVKQTLGAEVDVTGVGDRYVLESMRKTGCAIGGEQSGHIIFLDRTTTGDGVLSSLELVKALYSSGKSMSELAGEIEIFPQVLVNAKVTNEGKKAYSDDAEIQAAIAEIEKKLDGNGRVLIRPSGTEPLVRVMLEGEDEAVIRPMAESLAEMISEKYR